MAIIYDYENDLRVAQLSTKIKDELRVIYRKHLARAQSKTRATTAILSFKTQRLRSLAIISGLVDIIKQGKFEITSIYNLREKHIEFLVNYWVSVKQLSAGTIANRLTYFHGFTGWIGKGNLMQDVDKYEVIEKLPKRSGVATIDKSWTEKGIDPSELISKIAKHDPHVGIQLALQIAFGLRAEESRLLRPHDAVIKIKGDTYMMVSDGTKGGRPRRVEIEHDSQLSLIDLAKQLVNTRSKTTIPDRYETLAQWVNHYYYVIGKYGLTKKMLGVTSHGLRHEYLNNLYQELTGKESAVRGGDLPERDILLGARQIIAEHAGHSKISKANAYVGSHAVQRIQVSKDLSDQDILRAMADCQQNKMKAALQLKCARSYLYSRLKKIEESN